tara:strand:- start:1253 stop:2116 length:864 start_codon:yes stop_codon:yes gene_type:complete
MQIGLQVQAQIHRLEYTQKQLLLLLQASKKTHAAIYQLPDIEPDTQVEHTRVISVTAHEGVAAVEQGLYALTNLYAKANHSTKFAVRTPGVLCFQTEQKQQIIEQVDLINQLKEQIKETLLQEKDSNKRYKLLHDPFPMIITLNVYRQLRLLVNPDVIHFNWANKKSITKITRNQLLKRLYEQHEQLQLTQHYEGAMKVAQEIKRVGELSECAPLRVHRSLPMQPIANINKKQLQFICTNPILVIHDAKQPVVSDLKDYNPELVSTQFRASHAWQPIIPRIHVYLKL